MVRLEGISHFDVIDEIQRKKPRILREVEDLIERYSAKIVFRGLVFNQVWEDPEVDKKALKINPDDVIVTITSAGCNTLNYLVDCPKRIYSLDINPKQNFLLELKVSAIRHLDYSSFWLFFGEGKSRENLKCYYKELRRHLSKEAQVYWDKRIKIFVKGFYKCGHLGLAMRVIRAYANISGGKKNIQGILDADDQREYYLTKIKPRIINPLSKYLAGNPLNLSCMGIHKHQIDLVKKFNYIDFPDYVENVLDNVLGDLPIEDNYFWNMALLGKYPNQECAPEYLKEKNFKLLKKIIGRVVIKNASEYDFLRKKPNNSISKFNLLDSVDWMKKEEFIRLFDEIHRTATPESAVIFRSGLYDFVLPSELKGKFFFDKEKSRFLHAQDRSGVYGSFNIYYPLK